MPEHPKTTGRVAVLVDCDNTSPDILDYALRMCAQFGHVVVRQGYGNHTTLANKWQDALVRLAFTPCLQYQYVAGKNTADIALALDALELMFDGRVETFCIVTSDSDFAYLCRKLRGRGATVCIIGEGKTPDALRNASDQFFEYVPAQPEQAKSEPPKIVKRRPRALLAAVSLLAAESAEGRVGLGALGQYMRRTDPGFSPQQCGYTGLLDMVQNYPDLVTRHDNGGHWVQPKPKADAPKGSSERAAAA
jgi:uncharacterized protein (TIGR00288 family)